MEEATTYRHVHVRFKTPTGWRNFYLMPESAYNPDVLKQIQEKFGATMFEIVGAKPLAGLDATYEEEK